MVLIYVSLPLADKEIRFVSKKVCMEDIKTYRSGSNCWINSHLKTPALILQSCGILAPAGRRMRIQNGSPDCAVIISPSIPSSPNTGSILKGICLRADRGKLGGQLAATRRY